MTDYTSLLERLRGEHGTDPWQINPAAKTAADAIEHLCTENMLLKAAFRVNMLRCFPYMSHEEIDTEIEHAILGEKDSA